MPTATGEAPANEPFVVCWDAESDSAFLRLPGQTQEEKLAYMNFTCICAITVPTRLILARAPASEVLACSTQTTFWRDRVEEKGSRNPISGLLKLFDEADAIVGYNVFGFDFPLIAKFYRMGGGKCQSHRMMRHRAKTVDLFARLRDVTSNYFKLDSLLKANGLASKSGNGLRAITLWEEGRRDELEAYCMDDVNLTLSLALLDELKLGIIPELSLDVNSIGLRAAIGTKCTNNGHTESEGEFVFV